MKKIHLLLSLIFLQSTFLYSQHQMMILTLKDGTKVEYKISEIIKIDFNPATNIKDTNKIAALARSFKLFQNYPNPFNPATTIQYKISENGMVELNVFDVTGRHIKELVTGIQKTGNYKVVWDGTNESGKKVASGFYIYTLEFEGKVTSKNMILIK